MGRTASEGLAAMRSAFCDRSTPHGGVDGDPYAIVAGDTVYLVGTQSRDAVLFVVPSATASNAVPRLLDADSDATQPMDVDVMRSFLHRFSHAEGVTI
jgi:hypothetical protein